MKKTTVHTDKATIDDLLQRGTVTVIDKDRLQKKLKAGNPLRIKFGIDPTGPDIHLGHAVVLRKLKQFQDAGHQIVIIIGDWTARIGDPTDRTETRPQLTADQVKKNADKYLDQIFRILDKDKTEITWQSTWFNTFTLQDVFNLVGQFTVAQLLDRDDFQKRLQDGIEIRYHEPIYSLLQAYDSVAVQSDIELGATEQLFNLLRGRDVQGAHQQEPQEIMTMKILVGLDGVRKMGKSFDNYIAVLDTASEMYGKAMSIPDEAIVPYFELTTDVPAKEITEITKQLERRTTNPRDVKMRLAKEIVLAYHSPAAAEKAEQNFVKIFQEHKQPDQINQIELKTWPRTLAAALVDTGLASSMSDARRTIEQGGVKVNSEIEKNPNARLPKKPTVLNRGKRRFCKIKPHK